MNPGNRVVNFISYYVGYFMAIPSGVYDFTIQKMSGTFDETSYSVTNGLLDLNMRVHQSKDIVEFLKVQIKNLSRKDSSSPEDFVKIHRMARMCWELDVNSKLTNLDLADIDILYDMPQNENNEWIHSTINTVRFRGAIRKTSVSILVADHFAKDLEHMMES